MSELDELEDEARRRARAGRHDADAIRINGRIVEFKPTSLGALTRLGRALEETGDTAGARHAYELALRIAPASSIAKSRLEGLGKKAQVEKDGRAIAKLADFREAYDYGRAARDDGKYQLALAALARAEELAPSHGDIAKVKLSRASTFCVSTPGEN